MNKKLLGNLCLLITAIIWGIAFPAQRYATLYLPPLFFSGIRMYIGTASLLILIVIAYKCPKFREILDPTFHAGELPDLDDTGRPVREPIFPRSEWGLMVKIGLLFGVVIYFGANLQQVGLLTTSSGKTAFITTLYIILVPIIGIFLKHRTTIFTWIGVAFGVVGLYLLCITEESFSVSFGDLVVLICALFWAIHILIMDYYSTRIMALKIVALQFFVAGTLSLLTCWLLDPILSDNVLTLENMLKATPATLYAGIFSAAVAFTFQCLGQRNAKPSVAAIIMSTESVFGAIFGFLLLHEVLSGRELWGCIIMFIAILVVQIEPKGKLKRKNHAEPKD